ncbi:pirin family protein [Bacteroidales bacterium]
MKRRQVVQIVRGQNAVDGAGVHLRRVLGLRNVKDFDPFLMLDGFDSQNPDDYTKGFPWHPHRGIETITYLIKGEIEHGDSLGNRGTTRDLECQWMTAGSGIIHQEMPIASERMLGCQIWLNLPAKDKMTYPSYGDITQDQVALVKEEGAEIRVIAGSYGESKGAFSAKYVDVTYLDVKLSPDTIWRYNEASNERTLFIYLLDGTIAADTNLSEFENKACAILFRPSEVDSSLKEEVVLKAGRDGARFVLLTGKPLGEPVAWGGPIVMNTKEELQHAFDELDSGTFIKH